jgi:hypothetical protein
MAVVHINQKYETVDEAVEAGTSILSLYHPAGYGTVLNLKAPDGVKQEDIETRTYNGPCTLIGMHYSSCD